MDNDDIFGDLGGLSLIWKTANSIGFKTNYQKGRQRRAKQTQDFQKHYEAGSFRKNVYIDEEIQVTAPQQNEKKNTVSVDEIAEEVEFEEL